MGLYAVATRCNSGECEVRDSFKFKHYVTSPILPLIDYIHFSISGFIEKMVGVVCVSLLLLLQRRPARYLSPLASSVLDGATPILEGN